ncbi:MAG: NAD(P)H-binding protein [Myxococcota bacterium]
MTGPSTSQEGPDFPRVLLAGATGFVGRHLYHALRVGGYAVRCATRDVRRANKLDPGRAWVELDLDRPDTLRDAMEGCDAAFYLVRGVGPRTATSAERERRKAVAFREAAREAGLRRIVYLGRMEPQGGPPQPLRAWRDAGQELREGPVPVVELRAGMILGAGSASWAMVVDLAARLPAMVLPRWLRNRSWPVAIDDVVTALLVALRLPEEAVGCYDVPGPEGLSHRLVLERVAAQLGARPPMWDVPVVMPRLSSYWLALFTRVGLDVASELVEGLQHDLDPTARLIWEHVPGHRRMPLEEASAHALVDERDSQVPSARARLAMEAIGLHHGRPGACGPDAVDVDEHMPNRA